MKRFVIDYNGKKYASKVSVDWIERQCQKVLEGNPAEKLMTLFSNPLYNKNSTISLPVKILDVACDDTSVFDVAESLLTNSQRQGTSPWQALLAYNRSYIRGEFFGAFYHFGPLLPDQSEDVLVTLNQMIFTDGGQGRLRETTVEDPEEFLVLYPEIEAVRPVKLVKVKAELVQHKEGTNEETVQKAYLTAIINVEDGTLQKLLRLNDDATLYFGIWDEKGTLYSNAPEGYDVVTYHIIDSIKTPYTYMHIPSSKQDRIKEHRGFRKNLEENVGAKLPKLGMLRVWERKFDQKDRTLLEKIRLLL